MNIKREIEKIIDIEIDSLIDLKKRITDDFIKAIKIINNIKGKVVIAGLGKSGLVGQKISATFSSTGTPSVFLHPVEALHGDIGIITKRDVIIIISQSGETEEVISLLPSLKRLQIPLIAITGKKNSTLAKNSNCILDSSVKKEACPMNLAPTASSIVQLAIGDALAISLLKIKKFKEKDFAFLHPKGSIGKKLLLKVKDLMHTGESMPIVNSTTILKEALLEMTNKRFGCTGVIDKKGKLIGIFTDGDLRRLLEKNENPFGLKMKDIMTKSPKVIAEDELIMKALAMMENNAITVLFIPDKKGKPIGIIHLHDILKSGAV